MDNTERRHVFGTKHSHFPDYVGQIMRGDITMDDVPENHRKTAASLLLLPIYREAVKVLGEPTREKRAAALLRLPETIRTAVEIEARRVFKYRQEIKK